MENKKNIYCLVCGFDFSKIDGSVEYQTLCPCCLFHYGFDEVGNNSAFYFYRIDWLLEPWNKEWHKEIGQMGYEQFKHQLENIKKIDINNYYFGNEVAIIKDFNIFSLDDFMNKWKQTFG